MDPDPAGFRVVGSGLDPDPAGTKMSRSGLDPDPAGSKNCGFGAPLNFIWTNFDNNDVTYIEYRTYYCAKSDMHPAPGVR